MILMGPFQLEIFYDSKLKYLDILLDTKLAVLHFHGLGCYWAQSSKFLL